MGSWHSNTTSNNTVTGDVQRGYIDVWNLGENHYHIALTHNYWVYDALFYMSGDQPNATFAPMEVNGTAYIGGTDVLATNDNKAWGRGYTNGCNEYTDDNRITVTKLSGTLLATNVWNGETSRATLAGLQVIDKTAETFYFTTLGSGETTTANASWSLNGAAATPYGGIPAADKYLGVVADAAGSTLKVTAGDTIKFLGLKENTLTVASDGSITVTNILADAGSTLNITAGLNSSSMNLYGEGNISISGDLKLDTEANPRNTLVSMAKNVSISGALYSRDGVITLGDGINSGMMTVERVEMGDCNGGTGSSLNLESGYTLKVTGSSNTITNNSVNQYKTNSFMVSEWANVTTMNVKGTVLAENAAVLTGDKETIINIENGGTLAAKGLGRANTSKTGTSQLNLKAGGKLVLGDKGVDFGGHLTATISGGTIGLAAVSATISEALNITGDLTIDTTKYSYGETALVQGTEGGKLILAADLTGSGSVTAVGNGTLQFGAISSAVDISAGSADIIFGGTLNMGEGTTFTAGSGSYTLDVTDINLFSPTIYFDLNGAQASNGFASGRRELISGGTIVDSFILTYGGNSFTINNENRTFGDTDSIDQSKWYVNEGSSSVSEVYAASHTATADFSLAAGTTLNVDASISSHVELKGNATLNISKDITMNHTDVSIADGAKVTLTGEGIYHAAVSSINDDQNSGSSGLNIAVDSSWKGQVNLVSDSSNPAGVTWLNLNAYGNENSTIKLTGLKGYLCPANTGAGVTFKSNLILQNSNLAALELNNGCGGDKFTFAGDISGDGNFIKDSGLNQDFTFRGDVENWTGRLELLNGNATQSNVTFTGDATKIKNSVIRTREGSLIKASVKFENTEAVTVSSAIQHLNTNASSYLNLEVNTAKGTTFTGVVDASKLEVKANAKASFTNSDVKLKDILVNAAAELSFSGVESLSVNTLELGSNASVKVGTASSVKNLTVTSKATLKGGELNANLTMADNSTLQMDAAVSMGGAALTLGSNISLTGALATEIKSITTNSQQVVLFTGVNSLSLNGTTYDPSARVAYTPVEISSIFNIEGAAPESEVKLYFDNGTIYAGLTAAVPEPATATLSLLALAGLCARRRRK